MAQTFTDQNGEVRLSGTINGLPSGTPLLAQAGAGSPVGAVTPTAQGYLYQDTTNGALYVAIGATSAGWIAVGGANFGASPVGVSVTGQAAATATPKLLAPSGVGQEAYIGDIDADQNNGDGFTWVSGDAGTGTAKIQVGGATKLFTFAADGSLSAPATVTATGVATAAAAAAATNLPRLSQLSPKFSITSGALPTVTLSSGTGAQVSTTRDAETVTPFTGDGTNNAATCAIALSPDNVTYSTLDTLSIAAGLNVLGALALSANVRVPAGWYLKLTAAHGTIGTTTYY